MVKYIENYYILHDAAGEGGLLGKCKELPINANK